MEYIKLVDVCKELFAGGDIDKKHLSFEASEDNNVPIYTNGEGNYGLYGYTNKARVNEVAITISARGTIGYSCLRTTPFYPAVRLIVAVPDTSKIEPKFLLYYINSKKYGGRGASIPQLTIPMLKNEVIPLFKMQHQKGIVSILDKINAIIDADKKQLELLDEAVKSRFIEMFEFDKYTKLPLSELVFPKGKISYGIVVPGNKVESGIPMIRPLNFKNDYIDLTDLYVVSPSIEEKYCKTRLSGDEILVQVIGQPGRVMMTNNDCKGMNITRNLALISYNQEMISKYYLKYYLELDESQAFLLNQVNQATLAQLPLNRLKDLLIAVPEFDKQIEFEIFAKQIDKSKFNVQQHLNLMQELLDKKMKEFFGGAE